MVKPNKEGAYTTQRFNLSRSGRATEESRGFKPDPGNLAVRDYRGASGNVSHGETVNPSCNRKSGTETPHLQRGAPDFYPSDPDFWCAFEDGEGMVIGDEPGNTR